MTILKRLFRLFGYHVHVERIRPTHFIAARGGKVWRA